MKAKRRVLIVDDHLPSRVFLAGALLKRGFEVVAQGSSGREALQLVKATSPDVGMMAVGLADMDGIAAAQEVIEQRPVPIILLTSHCDPETIERAKEAGVMAYLLKPLREEELVPVVELAISRFDEFISLRRQNEDLKRTLEARKIIERAKGILMKNQGVSESEAFQRIQRKSMETRKPMVEIAEAILLTGEWDVERRK